MLHRYGLPYQGSKNTIAGWVVSNLPAAPTLIDLFAGGCAVTHAALLSGKWQRVVANDIHAEVPRFFVDVISGKYTTATQTRWVPRDEFHARKNGTTADDAYVGLVWSFGNDRDSYIYGLTIEEAKHCLHNIVFADTPHERMKAVRAFLRYLTKQDPATCCELATKLSKGGTLQSYQRVESLERMARFGDLDDLAPLYKLEISGVDYREVAIPEDAVVYCDIPYSGTQEFYNLHFDREAFLDWAASQTVPVVISEYNIDDARFAVLAETSKTQLSTPGTKWMSKVTERLYVPRNQEERIRELLTSQATQQTTMDFTDTEAQVNE